MTQQLAFLQSPRDAHENLRNLPEGLHYRDELISPTEEAALVARIGEFPFKEFEFHGFKGKRRVVSFGWQYEFSGRGSLKRANDIPEVLLPVRAAAAKMVGIEPGSLQHVLVIEYGPGVGIGWHRDKPVFGEVVGVSLLAACMLRFRRKVTNGPGGGAVGADSSSNPMLTATRHPWQRFNLLAHPRSAYHLTGPARSEWEHSILRVDALRYSITFRTMREE